MIVLTMVRKAGFNVNEQPFRVTSKGQEAYRFVQSIRKWCNETTDGVTLPNSRIAKFRKYCKVNGFETTIA